MVRNLRVLVASPLARIVAGPLAQAIPNATVVPAVDPESVRREVVGQVRFDVVSADLIWNRPDLEYRYDGFDVLETLRRADRLAPVLLAAQGHSMENDHLDEAARRDEVFGVFQKSAGFDAFRAAVQLAAVGRRTDWDDPAGARPALYDLFTGRRGRTAGLLAGTIAAGRASDTATLAAAAGVATNTANKVAGRYLGPIMAARDEHDPALPVTLPAVYRWCGIHARYLVSWCRRHGYADIAAPLTALTP